MRWKAITCGALLILAGITPTASAAPITGILNFTGSVEVTTTSIDWIPNGTGEGVVFTVDPGTEYFSGIFNPAVSPPFEGDSLDLPAGALPLANFLNDFTAPGYGGLSFTLTDLPASVAPLCTGAEAVDQSCSLFAGSPFTLTQRAGGVDVSLGVLGFFIDLAFGDPGTENTASGRYTTQLNSADQNSIQEIRQIILGADLTPFTGDDGAIRSSYSATYTATAVAVPEPLTLGLFAFGLSVAGYRLRRRRMP